MATASNPQVIEPQPQPRKKGKFWRGLGLATVLVVGSATAFGTLTPQGRKIGQDVTKAAQIGWDVQQNPNLIFDNVNDDRVNILLIGEDRSWKETEVFNPKTGKMARFHVIDEDEARSDTMIVISLDRAGKTMRMVSFPRDARVRYLDLDGRRQRGKMNSVYTTGGKDPAKREQVLRNFFRDEIGLRIDRVARIRIEGFTELIDKVGGLDIDVDGATERVNGKIKHGQHIFYQDTYGQWKVDLDPGMQHLDGTQAVGYARFRYDREGDPGRIRRQQQVMRALAKKITATTPLQLPGVVQEAQQQFATDMTDQELASLALFARNLGVDAKISPLTVFGIYADDKSDVILNKPDNVKLFSTVFGNTFDASRFLNTYRSPYTKRDDLGRVNNTSPAAIEVLREAGIIEPEEKIEAQQPAR